eukprot:gene7308-14901_t
MLPALVSLLVFAIIINVSAEYNQAYHGSHHLSPYSSQSYVVSEQSYFHSIENIERRKVLDFIERTLLRLIDANDHFHERAFGKNEQQNVGLNPFHAEYRNIVKSIKSLLDKLNSSKFTFKNFTLIMTLLYMDRAANILKIYSTSKTVTRLFGGCFLLACKMNGDEINRDTLAAVLNINLKDLYNIESSLVNGIHDLSINPQIIMTYLRPLLNSARGGDVNTAKIVKASIPAPLDVFTQFDYVELFGERDFNLFR